MDKIELTVHEFMMIMGTLDEQFGGRQSAAGESIYAAWHEQWRALDARLEKLGLMERADMLFDGKVAINALAEQHFRELLKVIEGRVVFNKQLLDDGRVTDFGCTRALFEELVLGRFEKTWEEYEATLQPMFDGLRDALAAARDGPPVPLQV